jgi:hypothetical protein
MNDSREGVHAYGLMVCEYQPLNNGLEQMFFH